MKNIEQRTVVHRVECCIQIKQDECSNFTKINRTNDIIHDTHYSSLHITMSVVCGLIPWQQFMTFSMYSEPRRNNPFHELEAKLKFDIGRYELAPSASNVGFLSRGKTRDDFCVSGRSPDCSDALEQYWSKNVGSTSHESSQHWIQRTMIGGCLRQKSGNLLDANMFKDGKRRGK